MCHPSEYVDPPPRAGVRRRDVEIGLPSGEGLPARLVLPRATARGAALIATDIFGANAFYRSVADRLAEAGVAALLPDIFFREGRLREPDRDLAFERRALLDDDRTLVDLGAACDWLAARGGIEGRVGTLGFCLGGNLVYHLCARRAKLATVAYYGFPAGLPAPKAVAPPVDMLDQMQGPILSFWGDRDEKVGMDNVDTFLGALANTPLDHTHQIYPGMEHGFLAALDEPEGPAHDAARDAWARTLSFLEAELGAPAADAFRDLSS